jgi:hypothetical protein
MNDIEFRIWDADEKRMRFSGSTPTMLASFFRSTAILNTQDEMPYERWTGLFSHGGRQIYEGDVIGVWKSQVYFKNGSFVVDRGNHIAQAIMPDYETIIGNIHESPELLK